jgi:hypothetical protein
MFKLNVARAVWTTNFDRMVEDAATRTFGNTSQMVTATIDAPYIAREAITEGRWPLLVKLHGDYHSRRLKNTSEELRAQDAELRRCLSQAVGFHGLAVVGYSGRDHSVIDSLDAAIDSGRGYPSGLFWFHRPETDCLPHVVQLMNKAAGAGVEAHVIEVETFDELMADVLSQLPNVSKEVSSLLDSRPSRISNAPIPDSAGGWPVIRLNAFPVLSSPTVCRRVVCRIGGTREVREAIRSAGVNVIAARRNVGVIAFGDDEDIRKAFSRYEISEFALHSVETHRLRYESAELGLLYDALCLAVARERPLKVHRCGSRAVVVVDPSRFAERDYSPLKAALGSLNGKLPGLDIGWAEGVRLRLEYRLNRLWLLVEPMVWFDETQNRAARTAAQDFARERLARRYNLAWNKVLDGWADLLIGGSEETQLRAFGATDGVDAAFKIGKVTAFTRRGGVR